MLDWDFWRWVGTTVIAVAALVLGFVNAAKTWRYNAHWTVEVQGNVATLYNRTKEDATSIHVRLTRFGAEYPDPIEQVPLIEADKGVAFETPNGWYQGRDYYSIEWTRSQTRVVYVQSFREPDNRSFLRRLRDGWKNGLQAAHKEPVAGRKAPTTTP